MHPNIFAYNLSSTFCSRLFHLYAYFFLFYNALTGLGKALRRVFTSAIINLFFLPRLDRPLLTKGLAKYDQGVVQYDKAVAKINVLMFAHFAGYIAYLSAVRVDADYNNPVMNVFVYLLSEARKTKKKSHSMCE